jgi:hypothetical protein
MSYTKTKYAIKATVSLISEEAFTISAVDNYKITDPDEDNWNLYCAIGEAEGVKQFHVFSTDQSTIKFQNDSIFKKIIMTAFIEKKALLFIVKLENPDLDNPTITLESISHE